MSNYIQIYEGEIFFQHTYLIHLLSWDKGNHVK